jgi:hypothetical protein
MGAKYPHMTSRDVSPGFYQVRSSTIDLYWLRNLVLNHGLQLKVTSHMMGKARVASDSDSLTSKKARTPCLRAGQGCPDPVAITSTSDRLTGYPMPGIPYQPIKEITIEPVPKAAFSVEIKTEFQNPGLMRYKFETWA